MTETSAGSDPLTAELDALATIARALVALPDAQTRTRVLRWALERFPPDATATGRVQTAVAVADPMLAVDALDDVFERCEPAEPMARAQSPREEAQPVESMVRGFVSDFQRLVVEWQGA